MTSKKNTKKVEAIQKTICKILDRNHNSSYTRSSLITKTINKLPKSVKGNAYDTTDSGFNALEVEVAWELQHLVEAGAVRRPYRNCYTFN